MDRAIGHSKPGSRRPSAGRSMSECSTAATSPRRPRRSPSTTCRRPRVRSPPASHLAKRPPSNATPTRSPATLSRANLGHRWSADRPLTVGVSLPERRPEGRARRCSRRLSVLPRRDILERITKRLIEVNDDKLDAVRALLGTRTLKATVDAALDEVLALDRRRRALLAERGVGVEVIADPVARQASWG